MINKDNYEAYFLDHIEGNLSEEGEKKLEVFLKENPKLEEELKAYDNSLFLIPDMEISFKEKESLRHKKAFLFPLWVKYSSVAAVFILICLVAGKLFFQPVLEKELPISSPIASNIKQSIVEQKEKKVERKSEKKTRKIIITKLISKNQYSKSIAIAKVEQQIDSNNNITKEPEVFLSNNLIAYEVNNLVVIDDAKEFKGINIIEVDNLIAYNEEKRRSFADDILNKLKNNFGKKIEETNKEFNNAIAYFQEGVKVSTSGISITRK
ncbi:MAG: hypothetical protein WC679_05550 [Bacteroidales bacterium]|jgi:hypothetical protein